MFSLSQEFHLAKSRRYVRPVMLFLLTNAFGVRVYSDKQPDQNALGLVNPTLARGDFWPTARAAAVANPARWWMRGPGCFPSAGCAKG